MSILKNIENQLLKSLQEQGYPLEQLHLLKSNRKELGDYQINDAMKLAKIMHQNPNEIAKGMVEVLKSTNLFSNINIAGVGFINLTFSSSQLLKMMQAIEEDKNLSFDKLESSKIFIDYGGANIAKTLHVGHLRPANLGEGLKRLARYLGKEVISDVHFGDIGRQSGMVIYELQQRYPDLNYFKGTPQTKWDELPITGASLQEIYPLASRKAKENEEIMEQVRQITAELEQGNPGYQALWNKIKEISIQDIKGIYKRLHTDFDLWEGESDCYPYMFPLINQLEKEGYLKDSEGAKIIEVKEPTDKAPMPPLVVVKQNGATLYATRELATLDSRIKRFAPDEVWYLTDSRQELYFTQVFRAAYKTKIVPPTTKLEFYGFGTMNGLDGKPFKTRDGNTATLTSLLESVKTEILAIMSPSIKEQEKDAIAEQVMIAAVKYADFLPNRTTDYIFDPAKFVDVEGKTGPYLLYSTIRMKSLLTKSTISQPKIKQITTTLDKEIILQLLDKAETLTKAYQTKELNGIADYLYTLTSTYNHFYEQNHILTEKDKTIQESWLALTKAVYDTNVELLTILGIEIPEKM